MRTVSLGIENLCVPCHASCRYCLLSSCKTATGVEYGRGVQFTRRVYDELRGKRPELQVFHYIGYCMDTPYLADYIRFCQEIGSPFARFLQFNGLRLRDESETEALVAEVKGLGIENIDLTFYGTKEYHDRFAGRKGDYEFLFRILRAAGRAELPVTISIPLIRENIAQIEPLLDRLSEEKVNTFSIFLPHSKGRGKGLADQRITRAEFDGLSDRVKGKFIKIKHLTEGEWLSEACLPKATRRTVNLCLTPENITRFEGMDAENILAYLEALDEDYYAKLPAVEELARMYGNPNGKELYRFRDLHLKWQQMYLREHGKGIHDMNEERHHFSIRI